MSEKFRLIIDKTRRYECLFQRPAKPSLRLVEASRESPEKSGLSRFRLMQPVNKKLLINIKLGEYAKRILPFAPLNGAAINAQILFLIASICAASSNRFFTPDLIDLLAQVS